MSTRTLPRAPRPPQAIILLDGVEFIRCRTNVDGERTFDQVRREPGIAGQTIALKIYSPQLDGYLLADIAEAKGSVRR